jgi:PilZ domain-containing protein
LERRYEQRELILKTARIKSGASGPEIFCAILDMSRGGARILLPMDVELPATFEIAIDPEGEEKLCRVMWKADNKVGVCFQSKVLI